MKKNPDMFFYLLEAAILVNKKDFQTKNQHKLFATILDKSWLHYLKHSPTDKAKRSQTLV